MSTPPTNPILPPRCKFPFMSPEKARAAGCLCPRCAIPSKLTQRCQFPALPRHASKAAGCLCPRCTTPKTPVIRTQSNPSVCWYPHLTSKKAYCGGSGRSGCRCLRCCAWYAEYSKKSKNEKQTERYFERLAEPKPPVKHQVDSPPPPTTHKPKPVNTKAVWETWRFELEMKENSKTRRPKNMGSLDEQATEYAWRATQAARTRCARMGITVRLTPIECLQETEIYRQCFLRSRATRIPHHVDHRVPLSKGGEHHPNNLQILTATENLKKGSKIL